MAEQRGPQGQIVTQTDRDRASLLVSGPKDGQTDNNYQLSCAGYTRAMHNPMDLVELAKVVQTGDAFLQAGASGKLQLISDQIKMLQAQARQVLEEARRDVELNHARCNFQRRPGNIYHLYRRQDPESPSKTFTYWGMLSPADYGGNPPHEFLGSYRLEHDMSWTAFTKIAERDRKAQLDPVLLGVTDMVDGRGPAQQHTLQLTFV